MKIAFVSALAPHSSTMIGRIVPLARHFAKNHEVHIMALDAEDHKINNTNIKIHSVGKEPFIRTPSGKKRLRGWRLITRLTLITGATLQKIFQINPEMVIIVKPLPHNVAAVALWQIFIRRKKIILDADDFELTANTLSSFLQRAAMHIAERVAIHIASRIVVATPFLSDRFQQITGSAPEYMHHPLPPLNQKIHTSSILAAFPLLRAIA
jgi:hypothetical protein